MDLFMMNCELLATCSALGYLEGDTYHKEPDCLESVKDLIRYLRHEDETRDIRQQLGTAQILQNDLIPVVIQYHQDRQLLDAVVRLMVNLTQPALLCFGKLPQDPSFRHHYLQVVSYLQAYKEVSVRVAAVSPTTTQDWEQRQEEDSLLIERLLLLVRNVLHVPADPDEEKNVDDDASTHDRVLWAVHMSGMDDLVKFLASSQAEQQWSLHILEIVSLLFRDQNPEQLAATGQGRSAKERQVEATELEALRQRELAERRSRTLQRGSRHSHFGGSYIIQGIKAIGDRDLVFHKGLHNLKNYSHDLGKAVRRVPKRRWVAHDADGTPRRSALNVRLFLKEFCVDFLENCYNRIMYLVKDHLIREKAQQHDETYYLWALAFFMAFNRAWRFQAELVSETLSIRTFHFIEQSLTGYYEMLLMNKKEATCWSRRMHLALKAYQELLTTLHEMDHSPDEAVRQSSQIIKNNIFYMMEYRELFLALFRKFDGTKQPRSFLRDLVETTHLFLKMLERFCKGRSSLVVQSKKVKRKKKTQNQPLGSIVQPRTPEELEGMWPSLAEQLKACSSGAEPLAEDVVPFDAASEVPVEEQRAEAVGRIQDSLLAGQAPRALALLRSAREVWPEGDSFGPSDVDLDEETELLKQILFANLPRQAAPEAEEPEEEAEEEEELASVQVSEKEFNFLDYMKRFASASVVKAYVLLFKNYPHNSPHTNHCVAKMLHRIACDLKMEALLFQLSVFCLFNRLLSDPAASAYKELVTFAKYIMGKFFALAATNKKAYVELLFWKSTAVVREMTEGYSLFSCWHWPIHASPECGTSPPPGEDILGSILAHLGTGSRTRKQVARQLVRMGLANSMRDFPRERKGTCIVLWTEEQEMELQRLFEEFQGTDDILGNIMRHLTAKRSKARVIDKLLSLGLVSERRDLYKRHRRKPGPVSSRAGGGRGEEISPALAAGEGPEGQGIRKGAAIPDRDAVGLAQGLRQEGLAGPLLWLQNCLNRTADDREEDGTSQPVPLVPLSEENEEAMEHQGFQRLLRKLGTRAPELEVFSSPQGDLAIPTLAHAPQREAPLRYLLRDSSEVHAAAERGCLRDRMRGSSSERSESSQSRACFIRSHSGDPPRKRKKRRRRVSPSPSRQVPSEDPGFTGSEEQHPSEDVTPA
uniref:Timeless circadian regulator n=1 Tax=Sphenodon punctatus TaxID=8508 RepID=A0A8D0GCA5_SPHPU